MAAARESLLDAAGAALARRPWSAVRMVEVAAAAGVSRQTLYNEFGGKDGLARALVRRAADGYLAGVERALAGGGGDWERLTAVAEWTAAATQQDALVRALLTGCWSERLPAPPRGPAPVPAQRRPEPPLPSPPELVRIVRDRAVAALSGPGAAPAATVELARSCELVVRLALSCVTAPPGEGGIAGLIRTAAPRTAL
ncbi:TetR/AcrR family transcriptional regulator [Streptomyces griseofuscus]|uniref:TetR/AcrR family transcriptional regulator n=1 Tax=Streptomyces TaxID=1883 RepID=UPI00081F749A|nr:MULTISPECIES: TetR/AcrR family transcriptional regulator [unclassified Streptomyces]MBJ7003307.1 helix-turn-helix transcriptional regulator [Streptomyces sp. CRPSP2-6A1]SCF79762.1 transcriptional regulator, TetR family [Streptomyces sp. LamerLS-31b]